LDSGDGDTRDWPAAVLGDQEAFGRVFDRHADLVYRFVRRRTGDGGLTEDVTAQVFLEAWRQRSKVHLLNGSLRSWLLGVAGNLVRRHWRSLERGNRAIGRLPVPALVGNHADDVVEHLEGELRFAELRVRMESLPRSQLEVLLLWAWEELSYEEIAEAVGIPVGTVRSRLSRARAHLGRLGGTENRGRAFPERKPVTADEDPPAVTERSEP